MIKSLVDHEKAVHFDLDQDRKSLKNLTQETVIITVRYLILKMILGKVWKIDPCKGNQDIQLKLEKMAKKLY